MPSVVDELPQEARVAVIRLRSLGDCVLTTPAIHILKAARPDLQIGVVVEERFAPIFTANPDIAAILPPRLGALRSFRPGLVVNFHGGTRSAGLTAGSGARWKAGFAHHRFTAACNIRIPRAQEILGEERRVHTAEHLASAMFYLGVPRCEIPRACLFAPPARSRSPYAVLHPVAATPEKTWPADRFLALASALRGQGLDPVLIGGPGDDLSAFRSFETLVGAPLAETMSLIRGATLFAGNDSGPAHIAAAFGIPVVVLFGPSDAVAWAPWRTESSTVVAPGGDLAQIPVRTVLEAVDQLRVTQ